MRRFVRVIAAVAVLAAGCSTGQPVQRSSGTTTPAPSTSSTTTVPTLTSTPVDWNDRSSVDIPLPSGWRLAGCEGDAPFLCASTADGTIDGTIMLLEYPGSDGPTSRADFEADAQELYVVTEEDRRITCGPDFTLEPDPVMPRTVAGAPGYRYGYQLRDVTGEVTERVVLHAVTDGTRFIVINTAFSDPDSCPGEDPERNEFPVGAFTAIDPYLDEIVARSVLPTATGPR